MTRSRKTLGVFAATAAAALILSTTALAALTEGGHSPGGWAITLGSGTGAALSPDGATEYLPFTIVNTGRNDRVLRSVVASVPTAPDGDAETGTGAPIQGCAASWFAAAVDGGSSALPAVIAPGRAYTARVEMRMLDSGTSQDACERVAPAVRVSVR